MEHILGYSLSVFIAFFAIMNPIVNIPVFVKLTESLDEKEKEKVARSASLLAFFIVAFFILIGKYIFELFGLTIPAFKIFGGSLIFYIGFEMLQTKKAVIQLQQTEKFDEVVTISPLAIPILAGPETIVTGMNFVVNANFFHILLSITILGLLLFLTYLGFIYSNHIIRTLGKNNFVIAGKIMGIVLGVLGANMLIEGIKLAFNV
jgi:multiple antibiotic resistance protein